MGVMAESTPANRNRTVDKIALEGLFVMTAKAELGRLIEELKFIG